MAEKKIKILLVDDEIDLLRNLVRYFEDEEYEVLTAGSGEEAVALLARERIDVGVIDMRLPGMDGNDVVLQAHQTQPMIKFIIHTGSTEYRLPADLKELGIGEDQVFFKPVMELDVLSDSIRRLVME